MTNNHELNYRGRNDAANDRARRWRDVKDRARLAAAYVGLAGVAAGGVFGLVGVVNAGGGEAPAVHDISVECGDGGPIGSRPANQTFIDLNAHHGKTITVEGRGTTDGVAWDDEVEVDVSPAGLQIDGTTYSPEDMNNPEGRHVRPKDFMGSLVLIKDGDHGAGVAYLCEEWKAQ